MKFKYVFFLFAFLTMNSCENDRNKPVPNKPKDWSKDHSVSYNQEVNEREQLKINIFLKHHKELKMLMTGSGLRYFVYSRKDKNAPLALANQTASVKLNIQLLDGTICYETTDEELHELIIDHNDEESGLNEALKLMSVGDKAKLILPNHLAHGFLGDHEKIPPLSILYIDVELKALRP